MKEQGKQIGIQRTTYCITQRNKNTSAVEKNTLELISLSLLTVLFPLPFTFHFSLYPIFKLSGLSISPRLRDSKEIRLFETTCRKNGFLLKENEYI